MKQLDLEIIQFNTIRNSIASNTIDIFKPSPEINNSTTYPNLKFCQ